MAASFPVVSHLGLPLHPSHGDAQQQDDGQRAHDTDVIQLVRHQGVDVLPGRVTGSGQHASQ